MKPPRIHSVFIGLGANLGDREATLRAAIEAIGEIPETTVCEISAFQETAAQEVNEPQPHFLNGVLRAQTELLPIDFLEKLQVIERKFGRSSKGDLKARPLDLDLLSYDDFLFEARNLSIPHPRLHQRRFVLEPLAANWPDWIHPKFQKTASALLEELKRVENVSSAP